jgi:branched-chain amino acid aminotransferase
LEEFIKLDKDWVPDIRGYSLYIRPTYISMTNQLGVFPAREAKLFALFTPVGPYFPTGFSAIKIVCSENIHRSWPGGFGYAKLGANYGPTLEYYKEIKKQGFQQILWLINDQVTEVGVMNFFVYWINKNGEREVITCPLDGTILPGVTRDSVIQLCKDWGIKIVEQHYTIHDIIDAIKEKRLLEAFGTGTAAIVCPIKEISYKGVSYQLFNDPNQNVGDFGKRLYDHLLDIQTGVIDHPWTKVIE